MMHWAQNLKETKKPRLGSDAQPGFRISDELRMRYLVEEPD